MKQFIFAALLGSTLSAQAATLRAHVIKTEIGVQDYESRPTLCLTTLEDVTSGQRYGLVEDITDCFWTRQAKKNPAQVLEIPGKYLQKVNEPAMLQHLQGFDSQLEFLWSI